LDRGQNQQETARTHRQTSNVDEGIAFLAFDFQGAMFK